MRSRCYFAFCVLILVLSMPCALAQPFPETKLLPSDGESHDIFGASVALSEDGMYLLIGASGNGGRAYVFVRNGDTWVEQATLSASDGADGDRFGFAVALSADGAYALIGARGDDDAGDDSGSA